ncbi:haloacid dehalogenase-like hydrolase [Actinokineospora sp. NBRC 105648]|uniref:HAD hydrolase-like protein n=1 Tax=Actinokineospora sp. NBRC 105648 TaxID=3032206 RepID=UPI0025565087|nr:haloacid dehalogenase-like hydrolase [Actinokineospora sp. NBRC 105648]
MLWDIDHTLVESRGVGRRFFEQAFHAATGRTLVKRADISGRTELDIIRQSLAVNDIEPTGDLVAEVMNALVREYQHGSDELGTTGRALPGAHKAVQLLAAESSVFQTVLTGNLPEVARIKLETFHLADYLNLDAGAYGSDHTDRSALVAIARERAAEHTGIRFANSATVLIGDTPGDAAAGRSVGARVIGVATGKSSIAELTGAGASPVIESLHDFTSALVLTRPDPHSPV